MKYTDEQFNILSQYEENLRTATNSNWARNPGRTALGQINDILNAATGVKHRINTWCQQCILTLLRNAGKLYFEDKAEREMQKAAETSPETLHNSLQRTRNPKPRKPLRKRRKPLKRRNKAPDNFCGVTVQFLHPRPLKRERKEKRKSPLTIPPYI